jgi:hypothetical protein
MRKNSEYCSEVVSYENQLEDSFDLVASEADQLYEGQGRLKKTYEHLVKLGRVGGSSR